MRNNLPTPLDRFDRAILTHLQQDGRATNQDVADAIGLSPSPCLRRIRRLEAEGVISGYVALLDPATIGRSITAFIRVRLDRQQDSGLAAFEAAIAACPEVMECYLMTGEADYQVRVLVASMADFEDFMWHRLTTIAGVGQVTSSFALRPVVTRTALPLE